LKLELLVQGSTVCAGVVGLELELSVLAFVLALVLLLVLAWIPESALVLELLL
jgi:hypothetical protein